MYDPHVCLGVLKKTTEAHSSATAEDKAINCLESMYSVNNQRMTCLPMYQQQKIHPDINV